MRIPLRNAEAWIVEVGVLIDCFKMRKIVKLFSVVLCLTIASFSYAQEYPVVEQYGNKYRFVKNGHIVADGYNYAFDFSDGLAAVKKGNKFGFINANGSIAIQFLFDDVKWGFIEGRAWVHYKKKGWVMIDKSLNRIQGTQCDCYHIEKFDPKTGAIELKDYKESKFYNKYGEECKTYEEAQGMPFFENALTTELNEYKTSSDAQQYEFDISIRSPRPITRIEILIENDSKYINDNFIQNLYEARRARRKGNTVNTINVTANVLIQNNTIIVNKNLPFKEGPNYFWIVVTNENGKSEQLVGVMHCWQND